MFSIAAIRLTPLTPETVTLSTLVMTGLLGIGLFFFLRASGKDRTETRVYCSSLDLQELGAQVQTYLRSRSYQLVETDPEGIATFRGQGQPSLFLTVFLTGLAALGLACLVVVILISQPEWAPYPWVLIGGAPLAGIYYRSRNRRQEQVRVRLQHPEEAAAVELKISGHRDELDSLEAALPLEWAED